MLRLTLLLSLSFVLMSCSTTPKNPTTVREISVEDFFKNSVAQNFRISPNGAYVAALRPYENRMNVFVRPVKGKTWTRLTDMTDRDIAGLGWKGNDTILFARDFGGDENFHVFSVDVKTKKYKDLTPFKNTKVSMLDLLEDSSPTDILITMNKRDKKVFDVYRLNTQTGQMSLVEKNPGNITQWMTDNKGRVRVAMKTDGVNSTLMYRAGTKGPFKKVKTYNFKQQMTPVYFNKKDTYVYAITNVNRDRTAVVLLNPKTAAVVKQLYTHNKYDVGGLEFSKAKKALTAATYTDWRKRRHFFDKKYQTIYTNIEKQLPNMEVTLTSNNKAETVFTVFAASDVVPGKYYTYDTTSNTLTFLTDTRPWLKATDLSEMKPVSYKSRDGLTIEGYLTVPRGVKAKNLPVVVHPHGGPWHRDTWGYSPTVQFLANRGYAVLQMNFRGSTGYGKKFWKASFKQWGRKMQDDVTDGVNWLVKEGKADAKRICIFGGSYGGYTTLAGLAFTPDLYKCGVDYVGVSNLLTFQKTIPPYWKPYKKMLHEMVGHPEKDKKMLMDASPYYNADKIKAPLFVAQGAKDPRVKKSESDQIVSALKKRGIDVPYMVKDNEGHGFRNEENRMEFYREMEKFLSKHLVL